MAYPSLVHIFPFTRLADTPLRTCGFLHPTDFLYEQYRSETLSRSVLGERGGYDNSLNTPDSVNPEELATQGVRIKEEQLRREGEPTLSSISGRKVGERVS